MTRGQDRLTAALLALLAAAMVMVLSGWQADFVAFREFDNLYFHADIALVYANMTDFTSNHYRTGMHPGFSLLAAYTVLGLENIGLSPFRAVQTTLAMNAAAQTAILYILIRRASLALIPAVGFTLLFLSSATLFFWHSVAETFAFGGTTLLIVLLIASAKAPGTGLLILGNVVAMSMTMTNWMAAFYTTVWHRWGRWKSVFGIFVAAGVLIVLIGILSKLVFPSAGVAGDFRRYLAWVRLPQSGDWPAFFGHSMVMPAPDYHITANGSLAAMVEPATLASGSVVGPVALGLWFLLLVAGAVGLWRARHQALATVLGLTALSQLGLHSFFSDGPFLFAAHFGPLLVLVAAHAMLLPRAGKVVLPALAACILLTAVNNITVYQALDARLTTELLPWLQANGTPHQRF